MIDEKRLIDELKQSGMIADNEYGNAMVDMIKNQPKVGDWISCSEQLPEDGTDVIVWFEYFRYGEYNRLFQTTGISYMYDGKWSGFVNGQSGWNQLSIIAWQPLPEPYNKNGEN